MTTIPQRLTALREQMQQAGVSAYIIPGADPHQSEYMAPHWQEMQWLSGFKGESGTVVVTASQALLWTDSRYYLQAENELKGTEIVLMRESDIDCPTIQTWLHYTFRQQNAVVAVNPEMYSIEAYGQLQNELEADEMTLISANLISPIWTDNRPAIPLDKLFIYDERWSGENTESKLQRTRAKISENGCDAMVIAALDEIGWLLNIRGTDVEYTPCVICYCVVEQSKCTLFIDPAKTAPETVSALKTQGITLLSYESIYTYLSELEGKNFLLDGKRTNQAIKDALDKRSAGKIRNIQPSPVQVMMSVKNETEQEGTRRAMKRDAVALTRFFMWLEKEAMKEPQTELTLAAKLHELKKAGENFTDESFCTIAGWKGNGAIVHYHAEEDSCAEIKGNGVLLLDSGGQYLDGTTDITRTVWIGDGNAITDEVRHDFTLVMKGHIALARARFPKGTRGNQLDVLAHQYMWQEGITYGHGTGHGVGHFMGCHEGPANIRTDNNTAPIRLGNIFSDEPGIYRTGEYGIRTENLVLTVKAGSQQTTSPVYRPLSSRATGEEYYEFETLTLCFYDTRLLDPAMLTADEKEWINAYHKRVYDTIAPLLNKEEEEYLKEKCRPLY